MPNSRGKVWQWTDFFDYDAASLEVSAPPRIATAEELISTFEDVNDVAKGRC